jgi:glyoxylase I family protein
MSTRQTIRSTTKPKPAARQRKDLLANERKANRDEPRNFKEDALTDKLITVEPDGTGPTPTETFDPERDRRREALVKGFHGVRYQVSDVARATAFYTERLGFKLEMQKLPAFANVSLGALQIMLSGPGASGSRPLPDGRKQEPGGWNRVVLEVDDLPQTIGALKQAGLHFRNEMESGPGGKQIQLEDPDGNPIELFEPAAH